MKEKRREAKKYLEKWISARASRWEIVNGSDMNLIGRSTDKKIYLNAIWLPEGRKYIYLL